MEITKLHIKKGTTEIHFKEENTGKNSKETKYQSTEEATQDFLDAFQNFIPYVLEVLDLPKEYGQNMKITGLSMTHEEAGIGIVISAQKELESSSCPFCLNTPYIPPKRNENTQTYMDETLELQIICMLTMAEAFMNGKYHAQKELDLEAA